MVNLQELRLLCSAANATSESASWMELRNLHDIRILVARQAVRSQRVSAVERYELRAYDCAMTAAAAGTAAAAVRTFADAPSAHRLRHAWPDSRNVHQRRARHDGPLALVARHQLATSPRPSASRPTTRHSPQNRDLHQSSLLSLPRALSASHVPLLSF